MISIYGRSEDDHSDRPPAAPVIRNGERLCPSCSLVLNRHQRECCPGCRQRLIGEGKK